MKQWFVTIVQLIMGKWKQQFPSCVVALRLNQRTFDSIQASFDDLKKSHF